MWRRQFLITGLVILALGLVAGLLGGLLGWWQPRYQGRTMAAWFDQAVRDPSFSPETAAAWRHFGTFGRDFLVQQVTWEETQWTRWVEQVQLQVASWLRLPRPLPNRVRPTRLLGYYEAQAVPPLLAAWPGASLPVRLLLVEALGEPGPAAATAAGPFLMERLSDPVPPLVAKAITSLGELQYAPQEVVPRLVPLLTNQVSTIRVEASYVLGSYPPQPDLTLEPARRALRDASPVVRANAARLLGKLGPAAQPAVPDLWRNLDDPERLPAYRAAEALVLVGGPRAVEPPAAWSGTKGLTQIVRQAQSDPDAYYRLMGLRAARRLGGEVPGLAATCRELLDHVPNWHCWEAVEAVADLDPQDPQRQLLLERALDHPNGLVRAQAQGLKIP